MNAGVVVDASALFELLLRSEAGARARAVIEVAQVHVPWLCDVEICSSVRSAVASRRLMLERAVAALDIYAGLPLERHGSTGMLNAIIALRGNFSAYDAAYVVLAQALDAPLLTTDERLARSVAKYTTVPLR